MSMRITLIINAIELITDVVDIDNIDSFGIKFHFSSHNNIKQIHSHRMYSVYIDFITIRNTINKHFSMIVNINIYLYLRIYLSNRERNNVKNAEL